MVSVGMIEISVRTDGFGVEVVDLWTKFSRFYEMFRKFGKI